MLNGYMDSFVVVRGKRRILGDVQNARILPGGFFCLFQSTAGKDERRLVSKLRKKRGSAGTADARSYGEWNNLPRAHIFESI